MTIGIIVGSIRDGRAGSAVGQWVKERSEGRDHNYKLIELADFDLPMLTGDTPPMALNKNYDDEKVTAWSKAIDECDGFIFVTPEYNHSVPGSFKNAVDHLGSEWSNKPVSYVGYSFTGGIRPVEHWRLIMANFSVISIRAQVSLNMAVDWTDGEFTPDERLNGEMDGVFDAVEGAIK